MSESLNLVFKYFFAVGSGVGAGLMLTVGVGVVIYKGVKAKWFS